MQIQVHTMGEHYMRNEYFSEVGTFTNIFLKQHLKYLYLLLPWHMNDQFAVV